MVRSPPRRKVQHASPLRRRGADIVDRHLNGPVLVLFLGAARLVSFALAAGRAWGCAGRRRRSCRTARRCRATRHCRIAIWHYCGVAFRLVRRLSGGFSAGALAGTACRSVCRALRHDGSRREQYCDARIYYRFHGTLPFGPHRDDQSAAMQMIIIGIRSSLSACAGRNWW